MATLPNADRLRHLVEETAEVGTLPHVMMRILDIVADESSSADDLADAVATDASLTAKILKIVNSAFYGFHREIGQVSDAVVVLGFQEIKRISLAISVVGMFGGKSAREQRRMEFWHHCFRAAAMADMLEREFRRGGQGAFTAGLLHDIGRAFLDQQLPDVFDVLLTNAEDTGRFPVEVELDLLGATHADMGFWLAERWNLPPDIAAAIQHHHAPSEAIDHAPLVATVHVADVLAHAMGTDAAAGRALDPRALELLGTDTAHLEQLQTELAGRIGETDALVDDLVSG